MNYIELINFLKGKLSEHDLIVAVKMMAEIEHPKHDVDEAEMYFSAVGEEIDNNPEGFIDCEYFRMTEEDLAEWKRDNWNEE